MGDLKQKLMAVLVMAVIGTQGYYFYSVHPQKVQALEMAEMAYQNQVRELDTLVKQHTQINTTKQELEHTTYETEALKSQIPTYGSAPRDMADVMKALENSSLAPVVINMGLQEKRLVGEKEIQEMEYEVYFTAPFKDAHRLIETLQSTHQMVKIRAFEVDNKAQEGEYESNRYTQAELDELVDVLLRFSVFARPGEEVQTYTPIAYNLINTDGAFKRENTKEEVPPVKEEVVPEQQKEAPAFTLDIYDILTSGATHYFAGIEQSGQTKPKANVMISDTCDVTLEVWDNRYQLSLAPKNGQVQTCEGKFDGKLPTFKVTSYARLVDGKVHDTNVKIINHTKQTMVVEAAGQNLGNIHIYNEAGDEVTIGQQKGNLKVNLLRMW